MAITLLLVYLAIIFMCCVPFKDDDDEIKGPEKTCKNCIEFERCDMWNYSFFPCQKWEPMQEQQKEELKNGKAD